MSRKFTLIQDRDEDDPKASVKRHLSVAAWLIIAPIIALVMLNLISDWYATQLREFREAATQRAVMTQQALPIRTAASTLPTPLHTEVSNNTSLYQGPGVRYEITGEARVGQPITVTGHDETGRWYQTDDGVWIQAKFLRSELP
jgi:hypothetical protein